MTNKELSRQYVKRIEDNYRWYKNEARKLGMSDIEIRAVSASTFELLGQNAKKLRDEAGL